MNVKIAIAAALSTAILAASGPVVAQTASPEWRTIAPENLLIIDTAKGRILIELEPRMAPLSVERIRTLADQGFYDGLKFHRVLTDFMAQTGDPLGTGEGGSELPDIDGEFQFRRGRDLGFVNLATGQAGLLGFAGSMPVFTQPDAQMMVTADFKTAAQALFCPGVLGMARNQDPHSANSQWFINLVDNPDLNTTNGGYTVFGRVLSGDMTIVDKIAALQPVTVLSGFDPFPLINYTGGSLLSRHLVSMTMKPVGTTGGFPVVFDGASARLHARINAGALGQLQAQFALVRETPSLQIQLDSSTLFTLEQPQAGMASFDSSTGRLTIPELRINGTVAYRNVRFMLTDPAQLLFTLEGAE